MPAQSTARWRRHRLLPLFLLAAVSVIYVSLASLYGGWIDDDAGISFTYARNLARGDGLVLNPGGERVEGYSNPLWVFLLALFFRVGLFDPIVTPKLVSIAAALASLVLLGRISRKVFGRDDSPLHYLPALALACCVPFVTWSISGLENAFYLLLILLALDRRLSEIEEPARAPVSGLILFLVALTRPEGVLYFGAALAHWVAVSLVRRGATRRDAIWLASFALPFLTYHAWHYCYFAELLPNTYYAKMQTGGPVQILREQLFDIHSTGWDYLIAGLRAENLLWLLPAAMLFILVMIFRQRSAGALLLAFFLLMSAFFPIYVGGDWMLQYRFLTPLFALSYLVVAGALVLIMGTLTAPVRTIVPRTARAGAAGIFAAGISIMLLLPALALLDRPIKPPSVSFAGVAERGRKFAALAKELHIGNASLLDPDLGGTSFASGLRMIDLGGLADVHIATHDFDQRYFGRYIFVEQRPTFIHTHCFWSLRSQLHQMLDLRRDYIPLWERPCTASCCEGSLDGEYIRKEIFVDRAPRIDQPLELLFDGGPTLVGTRLESGVIPAGGTLHLTTWWTATAPIEGEIGLEVTPIGPGGRRMPGEAHLFTHGIYPPSRWLQDELIREENEFTIPAGESKGDHEIEVRLTGAVMSVPQVVAVFQVAAPEKPAAAPVESSIRLAEALMQSGDLQAATDMLAEAGSAAPGQEQLAASLSNLSGLWYRRGEELRTSADSFLRWGEAMNAFQEALASRPANAFARKRIEAMRSRDYIDRVYGASIREAQEGRMTAEPARLLMRIEDEGFSEETDEILKKSAPIREHLVAEGTLASLSLLHRACALLGDAERQAGVQARLDAIAPSRVELADHLIYLGSRFEPGGMGHFSISWWFQVTGKIRPDHEILLRVLPVDADQAQFVNLDHFPETGTSTWKPGAIVRHHFSSRLAPGSYRFQFGVSDSGTPTIDMGRFDIR